MAGAIFQGGVFGMTGKFPEKYINAYVIGQSLAGVFAAVARIVSIASGASFISSAFIFFTIAAAVLGVTVAIYSRVIESVSKCFIKCIVDTTISIGYKNTGKALIGTKHILLYCSN